MLKVLFALILSLQAHADVSVPRAKQYAWTVYDVAQSGGQSVPHSLNLTIPGGGVITDVWVYINTAFTNSGTASLGFQCAGTLDIMAYNNMAAWSKDNVVGRRLTPTAPGAAALIGESANLSQVALNAGVGSVPTACDFKAVVRGDAGYSPYTAGKATVIVEYFKLQ